jgi:glycosyltransferase involved in cell wall biosynthesis
MCGIYGKLSSHQIDVTIAETAAVRLGHRGPDERQHRRALLIVVPRLVSYLNFLRELCGALMAAGVEVHVACSPAPLGNEELAAAADGVQLHHIEFPRGMNPAAHLRAARALNRLVKMLRPDIVHVHFSAAIFTSALARTSRWPVTHATFHGVSFLAMCGWKAMLLRAMETWAVRRLDTAWVLTDDDRDGLQTAAPRAIVRKFPGFGVGCDLEKFAPVNAAERTAIRTQFGIAREHVAFAFLGRFVRFKGFADVARAFLALSETNPEARALLIGTRDRLHPSGLSAEEERVLKASPQIIDIGFRTDVERCLAAADVLVFPSRREGMPVCAMEALALGVPVITCDARGCREVVRDGVDGVVLRDARVPSLRAAMQLVLDDEGLRRRWSAEALAGRERFSRARFIAEQTRIYENHFATARTEPLAVAAC